METELTRRKKRIRELAERAVQAAVQSLYVEMPFLDTALFRLRFAPDGSGTVKTWTTEGRVALYSPQHVLEVYRESAARLAHEALHVVLHCVFRHMFVDDGIDHELWGTASDAAVEALIDSLGLTAVTDGRENERGAYGALLFDAPMAITAERVYRSLADGSLSDADRVLLGEACYVDEHLWYGAGDSDGEVGEVDDEQDGPDNDASSDGGDGDSGDELADASLSAAADGDQAVLEQLREEWERAARSVQQGLESLESSPAAGMDSADLLQALRALNRKRYDYRQFLRAFTSWDEQLRTNDEEFDYIYYTLGLEHYGDMPLIEPLEYQQLKRLRDIAVIIDTSGSVAGDTLQRLFERTFDLIYSEQTAARHFRIHMIQADAQVKSDLVLNSREDLEHALGSMEFAGLGGTDFRPAFAYVDDLVAQGAFVNFKGVLYFTDGRGTFPERPPAYRSAFVFVDEGLDDVRVPVWAVKIVLGDDDVCAL